MSAARVVDVADAIAAWIAAQWQPTAPDAVTRCWVARINLNPDDPATLIQGRQVFVLPALQDVKAISRSMWRNTYTLGVLVAERFTEAGDPPESFTDDLVLWAEQTLFYPLSAPDLVLTGPAGIAEAVQPDPETPPAVDVLVDREQLVECKTAFIQYTFTFADVSDHTGAS